MDSSKLAALIANKDYSQALDLLFAGLNAFEAGYDYGQQYLINRTPDEVLDFFSQLAELIEQLFLADDCKPNQQQHLGLLLHKSKLTAIFAVSRYQTTDRLIKALQQQPASIERDLKILLFYHFNNELELDVWSLLENLPEQAVDNCLALLAKRRVFHPNCQKRYQKFLDGFSNIESCVMNDHSLPLLAQAWYQAAYDNAPNKHRVIASLNQLINQWLVSHGVDPAYLPAKKAQKKPRLLVIVEHFHSQHAMYRCYVNAIKAIKKSYRLIAVGEANAVDKKSLALFDEFIAVKLTVPQDVLPLIDKLQKLNADACYFTSIGMKQWSIILANCRLAKTQFATAGHPISSGSRYIDYLLLEDHKYNEAIYFSERVLGLPSGNFGFVLPDHQLPKVQPSEPLKIAITATAEKLTADYLSAVAEIVNTCQQQVIVCSFSNCQGLDYHHVSRKLRACLPEVYVFPALSYNDYLQHLASCALYLAPYPFGGTNSTIDCLRIALPSIALSMDDLACSDAFILRHVGLTDCVADSRASFISKAVNLLNNPKQRLAVKQQLQQLGNDLSGLLGGENKGEPFRAAIDYALNHQPSAAFTPAKQILL